MTAISFDAKRDGEGKVERLTIIEAGRLAIRTIDLTRADVSRLLAFLQEDLAVLDGEFGLT